MRNDRPPVGIDFGMTNSLLTYLDRTGHPKEFVSKAAKGFVIPTAVEDPDTPVLQRLWGMLVRNRATSQKGREFKLRLVDVGRHRYPSERKELAAYKCAKAFLEALLHDYVTRSAVDGLDRIALAVPDNWISGPDSVALVPLAEIFEELRLPKPEFVSEPVAAGCYFNHCQRLADKPPFDGHALVYDHGGGTLDLSILRIQGANIEVVASTGLARDALQGGPAAASDWFAGIVAEHGFGGVAFDNAIFERVALRHPRLKRKTMDASKKAAWLFEFEEKKRYCQALTTYVADKRAGRAAEDRAAFDVQEEEVLISDIVDTFEQHFAPTIRARVLDLVGNTRTLNRIDTRFAKSFRVVSVGGFSEFPMVESLLADCLSNGRIDDPILQSGLPEQERWLAVAKGACLVAADVVNLNKTCPYTFGVVYFEEKNAAQLRAALMVEGRSQADYFTPVLDGSMEFKPRAFGQTPHGALRFYIQRAGDGKVTVLRMKQAFEKTLPDHKTARHWQLCCWVDNGAIVVRVRSSKGTIRDIPMGKILALTDARVDHVIYE